MLGKSVLDASLDFNISIETEYLVNQCCMREQKKLHDHEWELVHQSAILERYLNQIF